MSKFPFLRWPLRLILYTCLIGLLTAVALIFTLQYYLDGLLAEESLAAYSFVGSLYVGFGQSDPVSEDAIEILEASPLVSKIDIRKTQAAFAGDLGIIPDTMGSDEQLHQHFFIEGTVTMQYDMFDSGTSTTEMYAVNIDRQWGADNIYYYQTTLHLMTEPGRTNFLLKVGQKVFLIGEYMPSQGFVPTTTMRVYTSEALESEGLLGQSKLRDHGFMRLPAGLTEEEYEEYILEQMEQAGILDYFEMYSRLQNAVTVHTVEDFSMLPYVHDGHIYLVDGEELNPSDSGKKICMISQYFAQRNRLWIGQTISLSVSDGCYVIGGYESGYASESDTQLLEHGEYEEFLIVGVYHQLSRETDDWNYFGNNDILIPEKSQPGTARCYNLSFLVLGPDHERFLAEVVPQLEDLGYRVELVDAGWYDVEKNFDSIQARRDLMLTCLLITFTITVLLAVFLLKSHFRYDYGLQRLLGAYPRESVWIYGSGFLFTALPGAAAAVAAAWVAYDWVLRDGVLDIAAPDMGACVAMLCGWAAVELAAVLVLMLVFVWLSDRRSLLRMVR